MRVADDYACNALEEESRGVNVVIKFESEKILMAFYNDPGYRLFKEKRLRSTSNGTLLLAREFALPARSGARPKRPAGCLRMVGMESTLRPPRTTLTLTFGDDVRTRRYTPDFLVRCRASRLLPLTIQSDRGPPFSVRTGHAALRDARGRSI